MFSVKTALIGMFFRFPQKPCNVFGNIYLFLCMVEKHSRFMCATGFRFLMTIGAVSVCGLSPMHAGNGPSKPMDPWAEMAAIQYNIVKGVRQLRTNFTDNRKFVNLLLKASEEYVKIESSSSNWKDPKAWLPAVEAYHAAFEELKTRLQGKWRDIFGDGPSRFPWNGHSDGATDLWREDDLRRDIPVVLSFWNSGLSGHICRTKVPYYDPFGEVGFGIPNDNRAYVPNNGSAYSNQAVINKGKEVYKAYVLEFFNVSKLSKCKEYLGKFFCAPVSFLLANGSLYLQEALWEALKKGDCSRYGEDVRLLLDLYADYYSLDAIQVRAREITYYFDGANLPGVCCDDFVKTTKWVVQLMVACYANYKKWEAKDQEWLCSLLDNIEDNYYLTENLHTYCIQSHDLLRGYCHVNIKSYVKSDPRYITYGHTIEQTRDGGLVDFFKEQGNPLPEATWAKILNYAGRRLSLMYETTRLKSGSNGGWHQSETFGQVPCVEEIQMSKERFNINMKRLEKQRGEKVSSFK